MNALRRFAGVFALLGTGVGLLGKAHGVVELFVAVERFQRGFRFIGGYLEREL